MLLERNLDVLKLVRASLYHRFSSMDTIEFHISRPKGARLDALDM